MLSRKQSAFLMRLALSWLQRALMAPLRKVHERRSHVGKTAQYLEHSRSPQKDSVHPDDPADHAGPGPYYGAINTHGNAEPAEPFLLGWKAEPWSAARAAGCLFWWIAPEVLDCGSGGLSVYHGNHRHSTPDADHPRAGEYESRRRGRSPAPQSDHPHHRGSPAVLA